MPTTTRHRPSPLPVVLRRSPRTASIACLLAALLLAGCTSSGPTSASVAVVRPPPPRAPTTTTTTELPLPVTPVVWSPCGSLQCGSVTVPLDYAHPQGTTIRIAVARHPAADPSARIGSVVINPGGPGGSGIDDLPNELSVMPAGIVDRFDVVSFDPRGVERSSPVSCSPPATTTTGSTPPQSSSSSTQLIDPVPTTPAAEAALVRNDQEFAAQCEAASGSILPFLGTVDTARDLDRIRAALGDAKLTYIGHSYGTLLGATYAELFPTNVRAMVLDGAIDPSISTTQYIVDQAASYEGQLHAFFAWCAASSSCPWRPSGDPSQALLGLVQSSRTRALTDSGGGTDGPGELYDALLAGLMSQSSWPTLAAALAQAETGNGSTVGSMSRRYETGGSSNGALAEQAIDCLDHPVSRDLGTYPALAAQVGATAPVMGPLLAWGLLGCATWPVLPTRTPAPATDAGAPPVLVVGTSADPVTPYEWAVSLASQLQGGVLLTWRGQSHVAYFTSPCIRAGYEAYLVDGNLPATGSTCTD